jgi:hypothetical protein
MVAYISATTLDLLFETFRGNILGATERQYDVTSLHTPRLLYQYKAIELGERNTKYLVLLSHT